MARTERDSMGDVSVPDGAYWGAQTQRAVDNFPISGLRLDRGLIWALGTLKGAAVEVNGERGLVPAELVTAIAQAAGEVAAGDLDDHFPVDVFQTGSGTSSNMNANEVIANRAAEILGHELGSKAVHPNDHVNASQSSNDVFPTACHLAAYAACVRQVVPALDALAVALEAKAGEFATVIKAGRTHLMDATPVTLGQEFGGWAAQVRRGIERIEATYPRLAEVPLGGTATGTGLNQPPGWAQDVLARVRDSHPDLPHLAEAADHFEAQGARDGLVEVSGALRGVAVSLTKVANDVRWLGSGPRTGLRELRLPELQPGSSIMPGKVNPVAAEALRQVCAQVVGNDAAVAAGGAAGDFELNVMIPVMARNVLEACRLLAGAARTFTVTCIEGIEADAEVCRRYAEASLPIVTALVPALGYDVCAEVSKQAMAQDKTVREVVLERGLMSEADLARILDVDAMAQGGLLGPES